MTFVLSQLLDQDGSVSLVVIADTVAREAWVVPAAGADPVPMTDAERELVMERDLTEPQDLVAVVSQNMLVANGDTSAHDTFEDALEAADRVLFEAQGGREPRADIPADVTSALLELELQERELHQQVRRALEQHRHHVERLQNLLTRPVQLPDRHAPPPSADPQVDEAALLARLDALDDELIADMHLSQETATAGRAQGGSAGAEQAGASARSELGALGLSTRTRNLLDADGIRTVGQLTKRTEGSLRRIKGFADRSVAEVAEALARQGLALKEPHRAATRRPTTPQPPSGFRRGRVKVFLPRGYGFVVPAGGGEDLFFHASSLRDLVASEELAGVEVVFRPGVGPDGRSRATEVRPWPPK